MRLTDRIARWWFRNFTYHTKLRQRIAASWVKMKVDAPACTCGPLPSEYGLHVEGCRNLAFYLDIAEIEKENYDREVDGFFGVNQ